MKRFYSQIEPLGWSNMNVQRHFSSYYNYIDNHEKEVWSYIRNSIDTLPKEIPEVEYINISDIFERNKVLFKDEFEAIKTNLEILSLMYFENTQDEIKEWCTKYKDKNSSTELQQIDIDTQNNEPETIKKIENFREHYSNNRNYNNFNTKICSNNIHSDEIDKLKKITGQKTEEKIKQILEEKYGKNNVEDVSLKCLGYDFKCQGYGGEYIYIEAKTFDGKSFNLTKKEYDFYINNQKAYYIYLLEGNNLSIIKNLEDEFNIEPHDYYCKKK